MIDFPVNPADGQIFTASTGVVYTFHVAPSPGVWTAEPQSAPEGIITANTTYTVGLSGAQFAEPGALSEWLAPIRIAPGVLVTVTIADGIYNCTKTVRGHIDGARIRYTNSGVDGASLVGADFAGLDDNWQFDLSLPLPVGITDASLAAAKLEAEPIVRAKYKVIFEFASGSTALACDGLHSGDWSDAPTLWINTGTCIDGVTTGTGRNSGIGEGPGGVAVVSHSCFFGFMNAASYCDYGGTINCHGTQFLFAGQIACRADFGGAYYGESVILIGCLEYGWRGNHGGLCYFNAAYVRGCNNGFASTNSPSMFYAHNADIQYCYNGVAASWGGSGKIFNATVKNNALAQVSVADGSIDARDIDAVTTLQFGTPLETPAYGLSVGGNGAIWATGSFRSAVITGHTNDIYLANVGLVRVELPAAALPTVYGTAKSYNINIVPDVLGNLLPPAGASKRPEYATVEVSGTTLTLPDPCPFSIGVIQPLASVNLPITVDTVVHTPLLRNESVILSAPKNGTGETVTFNESASLSLSAPSRYLGGARDFLEVVRAANVALVMERAHKRNQLNVATETNRVRMQTPPGGYTVVRDDNVVVINKAANEATAITLDATLNSAGREVIIKDGRGNAATWNITITASTTIDGAATKVINVNWASVRLIFNGTQWNEL